jgi:hypothetical protein
MSFPNRYEHRDITGLLDRVIGQLAAMLETNTAVDIVEFATSPDYLNLNLYPRQRLLLKLYYKLDLTDEELADVKYCLSCADKYAKIYMPELCEHHITGYCEKKFCHDWQNREYGEQRQNDYRILPDDELRERLKSHYAHILEVIAGRRGSKSMLGAIVNVYELYKLNRDPNPQKTWNLIPGQPIGTANVATDEKQAQGLFDQMKALMDNSPWFRRLRYTANLTAIDFSGRALYARSMHSNSSSVRGNTLIAINIDEYCFFNRTAGKLSDVAMWAAIVPSILTFKHEARVVITSSPLNKAGMAYNFFAAAEQRETIHVIAAQFAAWEMNPTLDPKNDPEIQRAYHQMDKRLAEMEFGGQWAEQVGSFIPEEAVRGCINTELSRREKGVKGLRYTLHIDLSKKFDKCGLIICHYDKEKGKVITDRIEQFNPRDSSEKVVNTLGEIDQQEVYDYIIELSTKFRFNSITFDQFNSMWLVQALRKKFGEDIVEEIFITDKANRELFANLRTTIVQSSIEYYPHHELVRQLILLSQSIKDSGNWKVEAPPGDHDDLADSLAVATYRCLELALGGLSGVVPVKHKQVESNIKHHAACKPPQYCVFGCPAQLAESQTHNDALYNMKL